MNKPKRIPGVLSKGLFGAVALCVTLLAGSGNGLSDASRLVVAQRSPLLPQRQPPSGSTSPQAPTPQPLASTAQGVPAPAAAAPGTQPLGPPEAQPATPAGKQPAALTAPQDVAPAGGQATSPDALGGQEAAASGTPPTSGIVCVKETKEAQQIKEIKDRPSDWEAVVSAFFGMVSAFAWPGALVLFMLLLRNAVVHHPEFREIFGTFGSVVRKITVAGVDLEIDSAAMQRIREFVGKTVDELMTKARIEYDRMAEGFSVDERLSQVVRNALPAILTKHDLQFPKNVRATVHVPDILFKDYLYQLVDYFPATATGGPAGRRFSQRYGMIGRAWRMERSVGTGRAVTAPSQLIELWGMNPSEANHQSHVRPAAICVILRHEGVQVGVLFIDSTDENAFGRNGDAIAPPNAAVDQVAQDLQAAPLTADLARAVAQVMEPMRLTTRIVDLSRNP